MIALQTLLPLLQNTALLTTLFLIYHLLQGQIARPREWSAQSLSGLLVGLMAILLMLTPFDFREGIIFDTRSILLSLSGLLLGPVPTLIGMAVAGLARWSLGGTATAQGLMAILLSGGLGLAWGQLRPRPETSPSPREFLALGVVCTLMLLVVFSTLPGEQVLEAVRVIALPMLLLYPASTMLLGMLHVYLNEHMGMRSRLSEAEASAEREKQLRRNLLMENSRDGIVVLRDNGSVFEANQTFSRMLGYSPEEMQQLYAWDWEALTDKDTLLSIFSEVGREGDHFQTRHRRKDGSVLDVEISTNAEWIDGEKLIFCVVRDISERKQTQDALALASLVYQHSREAMMVMNLDGRIIDVNPRFTEVTGYGKDEATGRHSSLLRSQRVPVDFFRQLWLDLEENERWEGEVWNRRKNGEEYPQWLSINPVRDPQGNVQRWIAQFTDISESKNAEQIIWQQANFDPLTGLPNRRMFNDRLSQEIKKASRHRERLALLFLDLDHFKEVNDSLGHSMGDLLLKQAAERLRTCVRASDTVARLGGDEFVIILTELKGSEDVGNVAQKVLWALTRPFSLNNDVVYVSTSIGITLYPDDARLADDMLKKADQAMYAAKEKGRNCYQYFTPAMQEAVSRRRQVANDLRQAISREQFEVYYQPIISLADGRICKAEALIRWNHPTYGLRSPNEFVHIAEDTGLIREIGDWVFEEVTRQASIWRQIRPDLRLSINKSPIQFRSNVGSAWIERLRKLHLPGEQIIIEITEGLLLDPSTQVREQLLAYRDAGVSIALDDFGTGYSSLAYLKIFDIDYLKIDKSFIRNLAPENEDYVLSSAIVTMAHRLGIEVIAEGVESQDTVRLLQNIGCDFAQGYVFSPPCPADRLERMLIDDQHPWSLPEP